ncbi:MAG: OsmC family protein [Chitinophagaceae bacterium]|nr:OsmC family protein [Chitinophagaceae bacterium]
MPKVIEASIGKGHYKTVVSNGKIDLPADEPLVSGGTEEGFSPTELLYSALATCTCITLRMYADRKQWPLDGVKVILSQERNTEENGGGVVLEQDIELIGKLSTEQRARLLDISKHCPVHQLLAQPIHVTNLLVQ